LGYCIVICNEPAENAEAMAVNPQDSDRANTLLEGLLFGILMCGAGTFIVILAIDYA
jgi:hypothetical protein